MKIIEKFTRSKTGLEKDNEDCIFISEDFAVVVDGITSKTKSLKSETDGRFVAKFVCDCFSQISADLTPYEILKELTSRLRKALIEQNRNSESAGCSIVAYNALRRELFSYGDCHYAIDNKSVKPQKESDIQLSKHRSSIIKQLLSQGKTVDEIQKNDIGRNAILDGLIEASKLANCKCENGYAVLNGTDVIEEFIQTVKIEQGQMIILSSDGYPDLFPTLEQSEENLLNLIKKDPLCIDELIGTKGVAYGNESYDDRSYVRLKA